MKNPEILSIGKSLSALGNAVRALSDSKPFALPDLMQVHESCRSNLDALVQHYIRSRHPEHELEQHIWQTVHAYLQQLDLAYASSLQEALVAHKAEVFQWAMLERLEHLVLFAKWHYLRYQSLTEYFWRELHSAYRMAEPIADIADKASAHYLQVLMLDSVNRSNMTRAKIELVDRWLRNWCKDLTLTLDYDQNLQQFYVDLHVPRGARRIRKLIVGSDCRYWHVDSFVARLKAMQQQLQNNELPSAFTTKTTVPNALRLVENLLSEWARNGGRRERRKDDRQPVMKYAQVVHGIFNVCQHVKNMGFAGAPSEESNSIAESDTEGSWLIENESKFGFGTFVYAGLNRWLEPGLLIAMDYDLNPDLAVVGIVRSIEQHSAHKYSVGIEVLSHTPSYVRLQQLVETAGSGMQRLTPFAGIFLPANSDLKQSATIVMPLLDYVAASFYELRTPQREHVVQLGDVLEQQADWIRVAVNVAADIAF